MYTISRAYERGGFVPKNQMTAAVKLTQSAMLGCALANYVIARNYHEGRQGFAKSASDALYWAQRLQSLQPDKNKFLLSTSVFKSIVSGA